GRSPPSPCPPSRRTSLTTARPPRRAEPRRAQVLRRTTPCSPPPGGGCRAFVRPEPEGSAGGLELVAEPAHRHQVHGVAGVLLHLRAQSLDVHIEGLGVPHVVRAPHPVDELAAGEDP